MARRKVLKNKPLVEAILELKWELKEPMPGIKIDPQYKLLAGRLYDRVEKEYPFHEALPTISIPDEISAYLIQHRFRKAKNKWPVIQLGQGIIALNDTEGYVWEDFRKRIIFVLNALLDAYPNGKTDLKFNGITLRYRDAIPFDFKNNVMDFLKNNMKLDVDISEKLFENTGIENVPVGLDVKISYRSTIPQGVICIRFTRGVSPSINYEGLVWETLIQTPEGKSLDSYDSIIEWIDKAHSLTDDWFFKIIEGDLERRFE